MGGVNGNDHADAKQLSVNKDDQCVEAGVKFVQLQVMVWEKCTIRK